MWYRPVKFGGDSGAMREVSDIGGGFRRASFTVRSRGCHGIRVKREIIDACESLGSLSRGREWVPSLATSDASASCGTLLWTALYGEFVGEDEFGNRYYRTRGGKIDPGLGFERRWVIYSGTAEASIVPPSWHGWLHHTVDTLPTQENVTPRPWWKPHRPNLTRTPGAYRPIGSTQAQGRRPQANGDYRAWDPHRHRRLGPSGVSARAGLRPPPPPLRGGVGGGE